MTHAARTAMPLLAALLAALALLLAPACGAEDAGAWVGAAQAASARADEALARGDRAEARAALSEIVDGRRPAGVAAEDYRVVLQDAHYRLSQLHLAEGDAAAAIAAADRGLALGAADDLFTANLYIARGQAREAAGAEVEAAADYHEALKINDDLLRRTLGVTPSEEQ